MSKGIKLFLSLAAIFLIFSSLAPAVLAGLNPPPGYGNLGNITLDKIVSALIQILLIASFIVAFIFLLLGGLRWITAGGDKAAAESARATLTAAIIGLIIVLSTWAIIRVIEQVFDVQIISAVLEIPKIY